MAKASKDEKAITAEQILSSIMDAHKDEHLNDLPDVFYKVSSGSLNLDYALNGGFGPGIHRFMGVTEGGKTSEALEVMRNFFKQFAGASKGLFIKAEGRLSPELRKRSGMTFVSKVEDWKDGTIFVLECNIYEVAAKAICKLCTEMRDIKLCIILDSVDGLITRGDKEKDFGEATKVAGGAVVAGLLMKHLGAYVSKLGHMLIIISQVRAKVETGYSSEPSRQTSATGGNALQHSADIMIEFWTQTNADQILEKDGEQPDIHKNRILGHYANARIKKSTNESTRYNIKYPIRHGVIGGSIWIEREIMEMLMNFSYIKKAGSWLSVTSDLVTEVNEFAGKKIFDGTEKAQGADNMENAICRDKETTEILRRFILEHVIA